MNRWRSAHAKAGDPDDLADEKRLVGMAVEEGKKFPLRLGDQRVGNRILSR